MLIRKAEINDLTSIENLFCNYLRFYKREINQTKVTTFLTDRMKNNESVIFLAYENDKALGFVQLYPGFSSLSQSKTWILNDLYIDAGKRGQGIGKKLMKFAMDFCKQDKAAFISLQTAKDNTTAQNLYENLGWVKDEEYFTYYFS